jgi:hypothetical protein
VFFGPGNFPNGRSGEIHHHIDVVNYSGLNHAFLRVPLVLGGALWRAPHQGVNGVAAVGQKLRRGDAQSFRSPRR